MRYTPVPETGIDCLNSDPTLLYTATWLPDERIHPPCKRIDICNKVHFTNTFQINPLMWWCQQSQCCLLSIALFTVTILTLMPSQWHFVHKGVLTLLVCLAVRFFNRFTWWGQSKAGPRDKNRRWSYACNNFTNWVQMFTDLLFYACWDTPSENQVFDNGCPSQQPVSRNAIINPISSKDE